MAFCLLPLSTQFCRLISSLFDEMNTMTRSLNGDTLWRQMWVQSLFYPIKFWLTGRHAWHNNSGRRLAFLDVNRSQNFLINFMHEARISLWLPIRWPFGSVGKGAMRGQAGSGPWSVQLVAPGATLATDMPSSPPSISPSLIISLN